MENHLEFTERNVFNIIKSLLNCVNILEKKKFN